MHVNVKTDSSIRIPRVLVLARQPAGRIGVSRPDCGSKCTAQGAWNYTPAAARSLLWHCAAAAIWLATNAENRIEVALALEAWLHGSHTFCFVILVSELPGS